MTSPEEFNPVLAVHNGLPPGLWLPTAEEPTEKYLVENFNHGDHDYEDIVDLGAFAVALIVLDADSRARISYMPVQQDFIDLYKAGYGLSQYWFRRYDEGTKYGGEAKLQRALGFYPDGFVPERNELFERLRWMAGYAIDLDNNSDIKRRRLRDIVTWGAQRDLLPSEDITHEVLGEDVVEAKRIFSVEKPNAREQLSYLDVYRFGARVLEDHNGRPPKQRALSRMYKDAFLGDPYSVIKAFFGSYNRFWLEFDIVADSSGLSRQDIRDITARQAIKTADPEFPKSRVEKMSKDLELPSTSPIFRHFDGFTEYRKVTREDYAMYEGLRDELMAQGVSEEVCKMACQQFEASTSFTNWLRRNADVLIELSGNSFSAEYMRQHIASGFDLLDEGRFRSQVGGTRRAMNRLGLMSERQRGFVCDLIPRIDTDETMAS